MTALAEMILPFQEREANPLISCPLAAAGLSEGLGPDQDQTMDQAILRERARLLAQEPPAAPAGEILVVVEFTLGTEHYGVESTLVREVYPLKDFTPLPGTPPFILGLMNVRGQILSITDLKTLFGLSNHGLSNANRVIILQHAVREFAILVDTIVGMRTIPLAELQEDLPTLTGLAGDFIKGITPDRLAVLHGEKLLTDDRLVVNGDMA
ncbi:MAG: chemotaxis protein CheW [Desulfobacca sp.]